MKRNLLIAITGMTLIFLSACDNIHNPFLPEKTGKKSASVNTDVPVISDENSNLEDVECVVSGDVLLTVSVEGDEDDFTYQWYSNTRDSNEGGTLIPGATDPIFKPPTDKPGTTWYYVVITNKRNGKTTVSKPIKVTVNAPEEGTFAVVIDINGNVSGDTVTVAPSIGAEGTSVTLAYTVADTKLHNLLDFGGVTVSIASVNSAESGTRAYTINAADSANGVITITAVFTHTDLELDPIAFTIVTGHINKTYGDEPFTNAVVAGYKGSGAITYSSSDTTVASVDGSGQVTIHKAGSAIITAKKAADAIYAPAQTNYTLTVNPAPGATVTQPTVSGSPTSNSITVNAVSLQTATGQGIEYAISTVGDGTGLSAWQSGGGATVTFTGLNAVTTYYVYARSVENTNYTAGTANVSAGISTAVPVGGIILNKSTLSLLVGQTETLTATVISSNATNEAVVWSSGNSAVATVNSDGLVTAVSSGTAVITVTTTDASCTAQCTVLIYIRDPYGFEMMLIPAGTFTMGSPDTESGRSSEETQHSVTLSGFYISKYQITQDQYQNFMGRNPSNFPSNPQAGETQGNRPMEMVTWYEAVEFCNKLSNGALKEVYTIGARTPSSGYPITSATVTADFTKNGYRLPTEAEWEYACRAGTTTAFNTGDTISNDTGWHSSNSGNKTHEVGLKPANAWGLYDMHGNVNEWCWDLYKPYEDGAQTNPTGASSGSVRVYRGGSWNGIMRSAYRGRTTPGSRGNNIGFRLVRRQ